MKVKKYMEEVNAEMIMEMGTYLTQTISKLRNEYGYYSVKLEFNEGIGGFDLYVEVEETEIEKKKRLIEEFSDFLDEFDSSTIEDFITGIKNDSEVLQGNN